jgi:hypothetical protein
MIGMKHVRAATSVRLSPPSPYIDLDNPPKERSKGQSPMSNQRD